jgi:membrane-bound serine protease (ClpP class)
MNRILLLILLAFQVSAIAQTKPKVLVLEIRDEIDPPMNRYVKLALEHATNTKADYVIVDMDSFGGAVADADDIVERLLKFEKPVWVFINSDAASAGAYISIACDSIYMTPEATMGAASVVNQEGELAPEKFQSYFRQQMRATAEANKRNPDIAEGMVSEKTVIEGVKKEGEIITLTTKRALELHYCEAEVKSIEEILKRNGVENYTLERFELGFAEKIIAFIINPFISGLLILIIIGGIYFEMQTPGVGFPLFAAITALVLYLTPYYMNGLAEYWEIIALFIGVVLILVEVFILPGFGVAGIAGITLTLVSLVLIMLNNDFFNFDLVPFGDVVVAIFTTFGGLCGGILLLFFGGARLTQTRAFQRMALMDTQEAAKGFTANFVPEVTAGQTGTAYTILRPSGRVMINNKIYDAFTRGEFIEKGEAIVVIEVEGSTVKVRKA